MLALRPGPWDGPFDESEDALNWRTRLFCWSAHGQCAGYAERAGANAFEAGNCSPASLRRVATVVRADSCHRRLTRQTTAAAGRITNVATRDGAGLERPAYREGVGRRLVAEMGSIWATASLQSTRGMRRSSRCCSTRC